MIFILERVHNLPNASTILDVFTYNFWRIFHLTSELNISFMNAGTVSTQRSQLQSGGKLLADFYQLQLLQANFWLALIPS